MAAAVVTSGDSRRPGIWPPGVSWVGLHRKTNRGFARHLLEDPANRGFDFLDPCAIERPDVERKPAGLGLVVVDGAALQHRHVDDDSLIAMLRRLRQLKNAIHRATDTLVDIRHATVQRVAPGTLGDDFPPVNRDRPKVIE